MNNRTSFLIRSFLLLFAAGAFLAACLVGCGGSQGSPPTLKGSAKISIAWPVRSRLIPVDANSITVSFIKGSTVVASQTITRPLIGNGSTVNFPTLPVGSLTLQSQAFPTVQGTGTAQASASEPVTIIAGQTVNLSITMASTITNVAINPPNPTFTVGSTTTLTIDPTDASGATVMVSAATVTWTSSDNAIATVTPAGVVKGIAPGTATITVLESESGKSASITVTVTSNGSTIADLANTYIGTLSPAQQATTVFAASASNATHWSNLQAMPAGDGTNSLRNGVAFSTLSAAQQAAFNNLIQAAMNTNGQNEFIQIRASDTFLGTLQSGYSGDFEYVGIVGTPSTSGPWLLQIGGHDIVHNYSYNGAMLASTTPYFLGVEPPTFTQGATTFTPLSAQLAGMSNLINSLTAAQLASAKLSGSFADVFLGPGMDARSNFPTGTVNRGILGSSLTPAQQVLVSAAVSAWTQNSPLAASYQSLYQSEISQTYVAFSGTTALTNPGDYVRIDGPHVWIEFVCQNGVVVTSGIRYNSIWRDRVSDYNGAFGF